MPSTNLIFEWQMYVYDLYNNEPVIVKESSALSLSFHTHGFTWQIL